MSRDARGGLWSWRRNRLVYLLFVPIVILMAWTLYDQVATWLTPEPRWVISQEGSSFGYCGELLREQISNMETVGSHPTPISYQSAFVGMGRVFAHHYGLSPWESASGPTLVRATFPDGQERLAWYEIVILKTEQLEMVGKVAAIFMDAKTGEPLALLHGGNVGDPCMSCGCRMSNLPLSPQQGIALFLVVIYLLSIGLIIGLNRLFSPKRGPAQ